MIHVSDVQDWHEVVLAVQSTLGSYVQSWFVGHHVHHDGTVDYFCHRPGCGAPISGAGAVVEDTEHGAAKRGIRCWAFVCQACTDRETAVKHVEPIAWVPEDELPESLPREAYDALYPYSRVDIIRWFPVFAPTSAGEAS